MAGTAQAAGVDAPHLEGADLSLWWIVPFAGILLSIAIFPLVAERFWHNHFGKIAAFWVACLLAPFLLVFGWRLTLYEALHVALLEYAPFVILLFSLFTVAGGVRVRGSMRGTPAVNTLILLIGTIVASWMGTTGAAMLLIRPLIRANAWRTHQKHVIIFFIFLVANIGGGLTPLGDPPLFLGFLNGVDFFWVTRAMLLPTVTVSALLLGLFYLLDSWYYRREGALPAPPEDARPHEKLGLEGLVNLPLLGGVIAAVLMSGVWRPGVTVEIFHVPLELQNIARDALLLAIAGLSWKLTSRRSRVANGFSWAPMLEVGKLFIAIFITIIPAIAILRAGMDGALSAVVGAVSGPAGPDNAMYFWLTGILSSFLDNAPTYLVFFNTAGGDAETLMGPLAGTLLAISMGAVFMGANTYIGNAPNFMVRAIAVERGVRMPSFFGYMVWSFGILTPCFALAAWMFL